MTSNFELCFQIILIGMTLIFLIQMSCENISMLLWRMYGILHQELWTSSLILLSFAWFGLRLSPNQEIKNGPIVYKILHIPSSKIVFIFFHFFQGWNCNQESIASYYWSTWNWSVNTQLLHQSNENWLHRTKNSRHNKIWQTNSHNQAKEIKWLQSREAKG